MSDSVDWSLALATGIRTAGRGPELSGSAAMAAVAALRDAAAAVVTPVAGITGLSAPANSPSEVIDRADWIRSNTTSMRTVLAPLTESSGSGGPLQPVTARLTGVQVGLAFGWLASKVLGQYEALPVGDEQPRLLLVAPNIVAAAQAMNADFNDFALWVCMHEETHRVQFGAHPWLSQFFATEVSALVADMDVGPGEALRRAVSGLRSGESAGVATWLQSPAMRSRMSALIALMSLLEGHADWVMDQSEDVVPSAPKLRSAFEVRRQGGGPIDSLIRRVLGLEAKMTQYRDGAAFVRGVIDEVGLAGFNRVWSSPATLPMHSEIHNPLAWVRRMSAR